MHYSKGSNIGPMYIYNLLYSSKWIGGIIGTTFLFASWVATGIISNYYKLPATQLEPAANQQGGYVLSRGEYHYINNVCNEGYVI
jgi:hypothetical protein